MEQKIFNNSNKSRVKFDLGFFQCHWWLRSTMVFDRYYSGYADYNGFVIYSFNLINLGILPVCII